MRFSGKAAQLISTKGRSLRGEKWWMARAISSLPTPLSPAIRTIESVRATFSTFSRVRSMARDATIAGIPRKSSCLTPRPRTGSVTSSLFCCTGDIARVSNLCSVQLIDLSILTWGNTQIYGEPVRNGHVTFWQYPTFSKETYHPAQVGTLPTLDRGKFRYLHIL